MKRIIKEIGVKKKVRLEQVLMSFKVKCPRRRGRLVGINYGSI